MSPDSRKTAAILCAAGALVVAAVLLQRSAASGGQAAGATSSTDPETSTRVPASCDAPPGVGSRATARLGHGRAGGALSAGKILRGGGGQTFAAFDLAIDPVATGERQPLNLALVIDRSGSMRDEGKLDSAKQAALALIARLGERDRIALIQYDDLAQVVVPSVKADAEGKAELTRAVGAMQPGGSTNLHGGMTLARDEVQRTIAAGQVSRVILLSDGLANAGESNPAVITEAARMAADRGVRITSVGVGLDYNEDLMEAIAESGRGNYYYVRDATGLDQVLGGELSSAQATVATQVELHLRPACAGVEIGEVFGYQARREAGGVVVPLADLFGGDSRRMVVGLRIPDRVKGARGALHAELRYRDAASGETRTARLALALEVTDDHQAVEGSVDADVMAQVLAAQSAETMREAARAYEKGDATGAAAMLRSKGAEMKQQAGRYGIAAEKMAPALEEMSGFAAQAETVRLDSDDGKALLKA
ncbi:MAG TPA: VWA domain-containing protein, partial [Kofleriaceae bacterium]|nr:VWA domain-containing protein [Kofleriaceae bacterium]